MPRRFSPSEISRKLLEECTENIGGESWTERRQAVDNAVDRMYRALGDAVPAPARQHSTGLIVAAVLDRLDAPAVSDPEQARLYAMSTRLGHQLAACDWMLEQAGRFLGENTGTDTSSPDTFH